MRSFFATSLRHKPGSEWESALREESDLIDALRSADTELGRLESDLDRVQEYTEELKDIEERLLRAQDKGADSLVEESNTLAVLDHAVTDVLEWPDAVSAAVDSLEKTLPAPVLASHPLIPENRQGHCGQARSSCGRELLAKLRSALNSAAPDMKALSTEWRKNLQDERRHIQSELAEAGIANPDELDTLQRRRAELADLVDNQKGAMRRKDELIRPAQGTTDSTGENPAEEVTAHRGCC